MLLEEAQKISIYKALKAKMEEQAKAQKNQGNLAEIEFNKQQLKRRQAEIRDEL